jgi:peroxygenase
MQNATALGGKTALQRHAAFFDPEGTGTVTLGQTWAGLGRLGVALFWRLLLTPIINGALGYLTQRKISFSIVVANIADGKHPFDTGVFGADGEIDEPAFRTLTEAVTRGALTAKEMRSLILARGNRRPEMGKIAGCLGSWFSGKEVHLLFCIAADTTKKENGRDVPAVTPRTLRRFYDGSLFHALARRRRILERGVGWRQPAGRAQGRK